MEELVIDPRKLSVHPAAEKIPEMAPEIWAGFLADVSKNGVQEPVVICGDTILDGRHRKRAAEFTDKETVPFRRVEMDAEEQVLFIARMALHRRHCNKGERALIGAMLLPDLKAAAKVRQSLSGGRGKKGTAIGPDLKECAREAAGKAVGVGGKMIDAAAKLLEDGDEELIGAVKSGEIGTRTAAGLLHLPKEERRKAVSKERSKPAPKNERNDADIASRGECESRDIRDDFNFKLTKATTGGVYTMAQLEKLLGAKGAAVVTFIRQCEVSPLVQVHRTFGRKGLCQFAFAATNCIDSAEQIQKLAKSIVDDPNVSDRAHVAARKIVSLTGG